MKPFFAPSALPKISPKAAVFLVLILSIASVAGIFLNRDKISEDISIMLPDDDSRVLEGMRLIRNSPWADKVFIRLVRGPETSEKKLQKAAQDFAANLPEKYFPYVLGKKSPDPKKFMDFYLRRLPLLLDENALQKIKGELDPNAVKNHMRENLEILSGTRGFFLKDAVRLDPLDLRRFFLSRLKALGEFAPLKRGKGFVMSEDGKSALITAVCSVKPTDSENSGRMLDALDKIRARLLPAGIDYTLVSAHAYSAANARVIRSDMNVVLVLSIAGLLLVFGLFLRRAKALWIITVPGLSLLWATAAYFLTFSVLSGIVLGFAAVLLGLTLDFGVHVYMADKSKKGNKNGVRKIFAPLVASGLTTCFGFLALSFSGISGIRQLSFLAVTGIIIACFQALFILPALLKTARKQAPKPPVFSFSPPRKNLLPAWIAVLVLLGLSAPFVHFSGDLRDVGYFPEKLLRAEEQIQEISGGEKRNTMLAASGKDLQASLRLNDELYRKIGSASDKKLISISPLLPAKATQASNLKAWRDFWDPAKRNKIEKLLREAGQKYGFSRSAFAPFLKLISPENTPKEITPQALERIGLRGLTELFLGSSDMQEAVYSYPGPDLDLKDALSGPASGIPGVHPVSETQLRRILGKSVKKDLLLYAGIEFLVISAFLMLIFRRPRDMFLAFLPPLSAALALTGVFSLTGTKLNLFHVAGIPLVIGLGVDYGIFMVFREKGKQETGTPGAVFISALSTILAFGALTAAKHPALHSLGISVLIGVAAASFCALFVLPGAGARGGKFLALGLILLCGCTASPPSCPDPGGKQEVNCPAQWNDTDGTYRMRHAGSMTFPGGEIPVEGFMILEPGGKKAKVSAWSVFGTEMFTLDVFENRVESGYIQPGLDKIPGFASMAGRCVRRIFFSPDKPARCFGREKPSGCAGTRTGPVLYRYDEKGLLRKKAFLPEDDPKWSVVFKEYALRAGENIPAYIVYTGEDFKVSLKLKEVSKSCPAK